MICYSNSVSIVLIDLRHRFTVPVLWDKKTSTIVNNESSEIIRIFNTAFNDLIDKEHAALCFYPDHLRKEIDEVNGWVYDDVNSAFLACLNEMKFFA